MYMQSYGTRENGIEIMTDNGRLYLEGINESVIRCVYSKQEIKYEPSMLVTGRAAAGILDISETDEELVIQSKQVLLLICKDTGIFMWYDKKTGKLLLKEGGKILTGINVPRYTTGGEKPVISRVKTVDGERNFIENLKMVIDRQAYRGKLLFDWQEDEGIYGLGQGEEGIYNYRGQNQYLYQHNMRIPIPFFLSDKGYGIFVDCASLMTFQDDVNGSYLYLDTVNQLDYYFMAGSSPDEIIAGYRAVTGKAAMLPKWAFGYVQSKEAYHTADEMIETARKYRELQVPIDCIVQDWNSWEPGKWGQKTVDKSRYPDLKEMNDTIHDMHIHTMVSVWPNVSPNCENHREFAEAGYLLADHSTYDAFQEKAREMYWNQLSEELFDSGFDSWWCDSTEPFTGPDWNGEVKREPWERFRLVGEEHKKFLDSENANAYSLVHARGIFENQRKRTEDIRVLNLTRSGYAGSQRYGTMLWSGDTCASWENFEKQIREGLNFAMSGMPYWTLDIGAFFTVASAWQKRGCGSHTNPNPLWFWQGEYNDGVSDYGYRELYVRWLQYGTFLPMFRAHGTDTPREIWQFGEKGEPFYDAIEKFIKLRYRLLPFIYALAGMVWREDGTMHRSLLFDFGKDEKARGIWNQFMLGRELLICPVTTPMYYEAGSRPIEREKTRMCYLPQGASWYNFWNNEFHGGGQWIEADAALDEIPLFVKAGSIIPMAAGLTYAEEETGHVMEVHIYPGQNGEFTLYEDENNNYNYEKGAYSLIPFKWVDEARILHIENRTGGFEGMKMKREFLLRVGTASQRVSYDGREMQAEF